MDHWKIILDGYREPGRDGGDVYTRDGEVIGTWSADPEDHCSFTPLGETQSIIWEPFLGLFCKEVAAWYEAREAEREAR
jgi:hypothetical protein